MFIKVKDNPDAFINTDNLELVQFNSRGDRCSLHFRSQQAFEISGNAGLALLEFVEANTSVLDDYNDVPVTLTVPLTSRIAQRLRDNAPNGMSFMDLIMTFEFPPQEGELIAALDALIAEHVVVLNEPDGQLAKYFHISNAPKRLPPQEF